MGSSGIDVSNSSFIDSKTEKEVYKDKMKRKRIELHISQDKWMIISEWALFLIGVTLVMGFIYSMINLRLGS